MKKYLTIDKVKHFIGGFAIAGILWLLGAPIMTATLCVFMVQFGWEAQGFRCRNQAMLGAKSYGRTWQSVWKHFDTAVFTKSNFQYFLDSCADTIAALLGGWVFYIAISYTGW